MNTNHVPETLAHDLKTYCNVNAPLIDDLRKLIRQPKFPKRSQEFRQQLADAIVQQNITPDQYKALTDEEFDSQEDLINWLRELWVEIFDNEPILGGSAR